MDYLKSKPIEIVSIGKTLTLKELSVKAQSEVSKAYNDEATRYLAGAVVCKYGVAEWKDETPEALAEILSLHQINEITSAVHALSPPLKNSDSTPIDGSSSN